MNPRDIAGNAEDEDRRGSQNPSSGIVCSLYLPLLSTYLYILQLPVMCFWIDDL